MLRSEPGSIAAVLSGSSSSAQNAQGITVVSVSSNKYTLSGCLLLPSSTGLYSYVPARNPKMIPVTEKINQCKSRSLSERNAPIIISCKHNSCSSYFSKYVVLCANRWRKAVAVSREVFWLSLRTPTNVGPLNSWLINELFVSDRKRPNSHWPDQFLWNMISGDSIRRITIDHKDVFLCNLQFYFIQDVA